MNRKIKAVDLFCGAGGTSHGLVEACSEVGYDVELTAINHWEIAVATHRKNHESARHYCASLDSLNPRELYKPGELFILWASPECTHHSIARGGRPVNDQSRATAWCVVRWAEALQPPIILVENVKEFLTWGPIGSNGKPLKSKAGDAFRAWVKCLESLGYRVEWRILCAADYGDPTTRRRLFVYAVRGRRKIVWPEPTHASHDCLSEDLFGKVRKPWVAARKVIDWDDKGKSIFDRKKPLAEKTMRRIMIGLEKFGLAPFIVPQHEGGCNLVDSVENPVRTVTTRNGTAIANPFLVKLRGTNDAASVDEPAPTVTAGGQHLGLAQPYLVDVAHGNGKDPNGDARRSRSIDKPLPTITCGHDSGDGRNIALCEPFIIGVGGPTGKADPRTTDKPFDTVLCENHSALVQPFILPHPRTKGDDPRSIDVPLNTVTATSSDMALVQPYLIKFNGTGEAHSVDTPIDTIPTKDRFALCHPTIEIDGQVYKIDILFRMLKPRELARAQGFPDSYEFTGTKSDMIKQIGNAVPTRLAKALVRAAIEQKG